MNRFGAVFENEFKQTIKSKAFKTISIILIVLFAAMCIFTAVAATGTAEEMGIDDGLGEVSTGENIYESDIAVVNLTSDDSGERLANLIGAQIIESCDEEECIRLAERGEYKSVIAVTKDEYGFFTAEIYEKSSLYGISAAEEVKEHLVMLNRLEMLTNIGVDENEAAMALISENVEVNVRSVGETAYAKYVVSFVVMIMMFICITLYGQLVATNVATEKSSRTMELLVTSASPRSLLVGKVLGTGAAVLLQISVFFIMTASAAAVGAGFFPAVGAVLDTVMTISVFDAFCFIAFFILGFLLIAFVYGALGSLVNQIEDLSALISLPSTVFMIGYLIAVMIVSVGEAGVLAKVCSFIPFWSPMVMSVRMAVEDVPKIQVLISMGIQAAACAVTALTASKIYRMGTLMYGKAPKITEVGKMLRYK